MRFSANLGVLRANRPLPDADEVDSAQVIEAIQRLGCSKTLCAEFSMVLLHLGTGIALIAWQSFAFKLPFMEIEPVPAAAHSYPHSARARLFELMRQQNRREVRALRVPQPTALDPNHALAFLAAAERSFAPPSPDDRIRPRAQPLKPVATTNFSELSARDAGGLTLATLVKRCLSSFWSSPSAPPARTFDTNVPPSSRTSNAR
ncbi:hypothetical protein SAMN05443432_105295 [Roseovarius litoreus]|uniref:Uncharacterized protein n=1 Tax=Roseovarius litoreus TaxID=1155722 RepID=A0A1M7H7W6_9RHOB|nr:hypothetical protein SAMN05443432_105295 [Roseovarius litoreus]